ncbi:hypothetical protein GCM10010339_92600 [Streptomyces alanosinicus]|uniref:Uncharacterized protein n=1 Tax=Streptomyces alanosinicus TaxID=68171 RepID=A0A918YTF5_9ACTN|nr:hypothetical protein GCM10010339_92600 [Streptomyces alanosinicus]
MASSHQPSPNNAKNPTPDLNMINTLGGSAARRPEDARVGARLANRQPHLPTIPGLSRRCGQTATGQTLADAESVPYTVTAHAFSGQFRVSHLPRTHVPWVWKAQ